MTAPDPSQARTIRMEMFELYERGSLVPLLISSNYQDVNSAMKDGDRLVRRWWVQERPSDDRA